MAIFGRGPQKGASNAGWVLKKSRFSTNISLHLRNDRNIFTMERQQELVSKEWCHFQWPWMVPNPDFKVMPSYAPLIGFILNDLERPRLT